MYVLTALFIHFKMYHTGLSTVLHQTENIFQLVFLSLKSDSSVWNNIWDYYAWRNQYRHTTVNPFNESHCHGSHFVVVYAANSFSGNDVFLQFCKLLSAYIDCLSDCELRKLNWVSWWRLKSDGRGGFLHTVEGRVAVVQGGSYLFSSRLEMSREKKIHNLSWEGGAPQADIAERRLRSLFF